MDLRGQGGGEISIHSSHDIVGDQHSGLSAAALHTRLEGEEVGGREGLQRPLVHGDTGVGIHIVPIAGEVLEDAAHTVLRHLRDHLGHIVRCGGRILAEGAVIHKVGGVGGHICHRGQVHVEAQGGEKEVLLSGICQHGLHAAGGISFLRRGELGGPQMGIGADPHHRAALLVHADQQRDSGVHSRGVLIALNGLDQSIGSLVRRIPAEEDVAAQMIGAHVGDRVCVGYPDKEQLADLFLQGQGGKQVLHLLGGQFLRRGFRGRLRLLGLNVH